MKKIITTCMRASIALMIITLYGCPGDCHAPSMLFLKDYSKYLMDFEIEQGMISLFSKARSQYVSGVIADKEYWYPRIRISASKSSRDTYDVEVRDEIGVSSKNVKKVSIPKTDAWKLPSRNVAYYRMLSPGILAYLVKVSDNFKGTFSIMLTDLAIGYDFQDYQPADFEHGKRETYYRNLAYGQALAKAVGRADITKTTRMTEGLEDKQHVKAVIKAAEDIKDLRLFKISGDGNGKITISHGEEKKYIDPKKKHVFRLTDAQIKSLPFQKITKEFLEEDLCGGRIRKSSEVLLRRSIE